MNSRLADGLSSLRRRGIALGVAGGLGWGLALAVIVLLGWMWLDLALDLAPALRATALWIAFLAGLALVFRATLRGMRNGADDVLARRLDEVGQTRGQILSGVSLASSSQCSGVTAGLAGIAIERAQTLVTQIPSSRALPASILRWPCAGAAAALACLALIALIAPRLAGTQWMRFTDPFGDHPPYSRVQLNVEPGDVKVVYGRGFDIRVTASGGLVEKAEVVLGDEVLPMFGEGEGKWRATVASVTVPTQYRVRAPGSVSRKFAIDVITVPRLENVRVRVTPPAYTNRPPYEGAVPQGGLFGLPGTRVELFAHSNRPLLGGTIEIDGAPSIRMTGSGSQAAGGFVISKSTKVTLKVIDSSGQPSTDSFTSPVTLLSDDRPFVRLVQPLANSFATPTTLLPVEVIAEDDYGVSRVQVFRSLNDSRPLPMDFDVPRPAPTRFSAGTQLPLARLGLGPGDVIKVFARVEDNEPAPGGPKGSESTVAVVRIISDAEYRQMMMAREGLEVLQSKYAQAQRRMEAIAEEMAKLKEELDKHKPDDALTEETRKKLDELARRLAEEAEAIKNAAKEDLPFDIDKKLRKELDEVGKDLEQLAKEAAELAKAPKVRVATDALAKLAARLGQRQGEFKARAMEPMEHLARIFPLIEDQARFIVIYEEQKDLAQRLAGFKDRARIDDPKEKARLRDLEDEQRKLRDQLRDLLDDIEQHLQELPEDPKLDELRETAADFARKVRESGADERMRDAADGLAEFDGTRGHANAREAEEILSRFIQRGQGIAGQARGCMVFQPSLADLLGDTIDQLLGAQGLGGSGAGGGGGYMARRSTMRNVGVYGDLARLSKAGGGRDGRSEKGQPGDGRGDLSTAENPLGVGAGGRGGSGGQSDAAVPVNYKRRVGDYFRRVADEIGK